VQFSRKRPLLSLDATLSCIAFSHNLSNFHAILAFFAQSCKNATAGNPILLKGWFFGIFLSSFEKFRAIVLAMKILKYCFQKTLV